MKKRILIALGVLVLAAGIGAGGWYYYTHHAGSAGGSDIVYVTKIGKLSEMDSGVENRYAGVVEPQETVQVKIESGRKVKEVQVKTGQEVKKGQLLFQYDLGSIQQSLQEAQLALDRLKNEQLSISDQITTLEAEKKKATADNQLSYTIEIETQKMNLKKNEYDQKSKQAEIDKLSQIIQEIEEYVDSCKFQPLSATKIIVNREEIEELLRELRLKTPDEIKRYQKIISNKDAILEDAQSKADAIIADAQAKAQELVTQHEIMQKAYAQANDTINAANKQAQEILDSATQDANSIRLSAITYTDDMMANIGSVLNQTLEDAGGKYKGFIDALQSCLDVVNHNRQELAPQTAQAAAMTGSYHEEPADAPEEDSLLDDLGEE